MKNLSKINNWSLSLLLLMFLSIFSMAGLLSIKDVQADENWQNYLRMLDIEKQLERNKMRMRLLAQEQEAYLLNNVSDPAGRIGEFSLSALQKTSKYHRDVAAVDEWVEDDHKKWRAENHKEGLAEGATRLEWRHTIRGKDVLKVSEMKKIALRVAYYADMKKLKKEVLMGQDGFLEAMDEQRETLLIERQNLLDELEFLKTHTDEEAGLRRDRPNEWDKMQDFSLSVIGKQIRYIDIGDTEEVELLIGTGTMPLTLEIVSEDGSKEVKTLTKPGRLKLPFHFTTVGNKTRRFTLTDSSIPRKLRNANVMFLVRDPNAPEIQISKTASPVNINSGDIVKYTYTVTNPGNDPLSGVTVSDDTCTTVSLIAGGDTNNDGKLDPAETWTYECSMILTADTTNTATASATGSAGAPVSHQDTETVTVTTLMPAINISKTASPVNINSGDIVKYTYTVTNPGNDPLSGVTVSDDTCTNVVLTPGGDTNNAGKLDPAETWTYECSMTLTADTTNTATVDATGSTGTTVSAQATATVNVNPPPMPTIDISKTATPTNINPGDTVKYTYKVTNPGNDPLSRVTVSDDTCAPVMFIPGGDTNNDGKLDPGETWTYECSITLTADTTNTATASGTGSTGTTVSTQATVTVTVNTGATPPTALSGDNQGPDLSVTSHNDDPALAWTHVTTRTITLTGTATDQNRGGNGIQSIYINSSLADSGSTAAGNATATWSEQLNLSSGSNTIIIDAYDNSPSYNKTSKTIMIYFDAPDAPEAPEETVTPPPPPERFRATFDCGESFELSPNDILIPKICHVLVSGYNNNDERVRVTATYDSNILTLFPDDQSAPPYLMYPSTAGSTSGYYAFSINFSTSATAPEGETAVVITVSQGASSITIPVTILVLPPGRDASRGTGIRPPVELATGLGEFCVWRYKKFGDPPRCFAFVLAACDTAAYNSNDKYELVGSNMSDLQAAVLMSDLSPYGGDAYGCHRRPQDEAPVDNCPTDDNKTEPGMCGCNNPDVDSDSDGVCDHEDICRGDDSSGDPDSDGICTNLDDCLGNDSSGDSDGDGVCNDRDPCPYDNPDNQDTDGDGTDDCHEECDNDPNKIAPGTCGCGVPDDDTDGDGIFDCQELVCTGNMEEFNGRCVSRCGRGERRNADGTCVFDPGTDLAGTGVPTCMKNKDCPENHICVNYKCIRSEIHDKTKERIGEGRDDRPPRGPESGATGGGAPSPTGDYGTGECSYDADCPYDYQICQNKKCITPDHPPHPPPRGEGFGEGEEDLVKDQLDGGKGRSGRDRDRDRDKDRGGRGGSGGTGGRGGTGGSGSGSSQPETSGEGGSTQPETPTKKPEIQPSTIEFPDVTGKATIKLYFPKGEGQKYRTKSSTVRGKNVPYYQVLLTPTPASCSNVEVRVSVTKGWSYFVDKGSMGGPEFLYSVKAGEEKKWFVVSGTNYLIDTGGAGSPYNVIYFLCKW